MATPPPVIPTPPTPQPNSMTNAPGGAVPSVPPPPKLPPVPQPPGAMKPSGPNAGPGGPGAPPPGAPPEGEEDHGPQLSFWQQPWVQNILPFVSSIAVHAGIIIIGLVIIAGYKAVVEVKKALEEQVAPSDSAIEENQPGGVQNVGLGGDPTRPAAQDEVENPPPDGWAEKAGDAKTPELMGGGEGESNDTQIGLGPGGGFGRGTGLGSGTGKGRGSGTGEGGPLAPFGTPGGGGIGPKSRFMGVGGNARTVAFVCDASGSMINTFSTLKGELTKAVTGLKAIQGFNIIFFQDEKCSTMDGNLVLATPENKRKAFNYLDDVSTSGTTNPIPGIEAAFKNKPQLIYLLTDADFPDNNAVLQAIRRLNASKQTKINTIIFTSGGADGDVTESFIELMKTVAKENGGQYKMVKENEISN